MLAGQHGAEVQGGDGCELFFNPLNPACYKILARRRVSFKVIVTQVPSALALQLVQVLVPLAGTLCIRLPRNSLDVELQRMVQRREMHILATAESAFIWLVRWPIAALR